KKTTFTIVNTPDIGAVAALSADTETDIWAVPSNNSSKSLHFDGTKWSAVPMIKSSRMNSVAVISFSDVWAVGEDNNKSTVSQIQHFDGSSWTIVPSPHFKLGESLISIKAISANDIFAVGFSNTNKNTQNPLVEHFDGATWKIVSTPNISHGELNDMAI